MRLKIIIPILLAATALLTVALVLKSSSHRPTTETIASEEPTPALPQGEPASPALSSLPEAASAVPAAVPDTSSNVVPVAAVEDPAKIQAVIDRLTDLQSNNDASSLQAILKELTNSSPAIRHAAIEAAIQFGGHDAVPVLKDLAAHTENLDERKELLDAAEYLALPSVTELKALKAQQKAQDTVPPQ
jgi:hypothetical protein